MADDKLLKENTFCYPNLRHQQRSKTGFNNSSDAIQNSRLYLNAFSKQKVQNSIHLYHGLQNSQQFNDIVNTYVVCFLVLYNDCLKPSVRTVYSFSSSRGKMIDYVKHFFFKTIGKKQFTLLRTFIHIDKVDLHVQLICEKLLH